MEKINLTDWLYRNEYSYIYEEWLISAEHLKGIDTATWLKEKYPDIWKEYMESQANDP